MIFEGSYLKGNDQKKLWKLFQKNKKEFRLVGLRGLEPLTSPLSGVRSNHLSYKPLKLTI